MWAPDVYEGAPTPITAFMSTAVKVAGFGALMGVVHDLLGRGAPARAGVFAVTAVLTMLVGNLGALLQPNIKRLLAYSSIAHAGYVLVGVSALAARPDGEGAAAIAFYLVSYTFITLGAFAVVLFLNARDQEYTEVEHFRGLARRRPALAFTMAIFMFALAGVPPTAGFFGKFFLFQAAVHANQLGLAIMLAVASAISIYYYLRVVAVMYMPAVEDKEPTPVLQSGLLGALALCSVGVTLFLGTLPSGLMDLLGRVFQ
jgi:NADH-quinone oxidoreductase subunit N